MVKTWKNGKWMQENGHLEVSASALGIVYIFSSKHFIFSEVTTHIARRPETFLEKEMQKYRAEKIGTFKKSYLAEPIKSSLLNFQG